MTQKFSLLEFLLTEKKKKKKKRKKRKNKSKSYGIGLGFSSDSASGGSGGDGGVGEGFSGMLNAALPGTVSANMLSILQSRQASEEQEQVGKRITKYERATSLFLPLYKKGLPRKGIINQFIKQLGVTESTAVSYYERIAKQLGLTNVDSEDQNNANNMMASDDASRQNRMSDEDELGSNNVQDDEHPDAAMDNEDEFAANDDPDDLGVIRTIPNAHLVYKRRNDEGTFDELWVYNTTDKIQDEIDIKRAILSGTDIPKGSTKSQDGSQQASLTTLGNGQLLFITGLPS